MRSYHWRAPCRSPAFRRQRGSVRRTTTRKPGTRAQLPGLSHTRYAGIALYAYVRPWHTHRLCALWVSLARPVCVIALLFSVWSTPCTQVRTCGSQELGPAIVRGQRGALVRWSTCTSSARRTCASPTALIATSRTAPTATALDRTHLVRHLAIPCAIRELRESTTQLSTFGASVALSAATLSY